MKEALNRLREIGSPSEIGRGVDGNQDESLNQSLGFPDIPRSPTSQELYAKSPSESGQSSVGISMLMDINALEHFTGPEEEQKTLSTIDRQILPFATAKMFIRILYPNSEAIKQWIDSDD